MWIQVRLNTLEFFLEQSFLQKRKIFNECKIQKRHKILVILGKISSQIIKSLNEGEYHEKNHNVAIE